MYYFRSLVPPHRVAYQTKGQARFNSVASMFKLLCGRLETYTLYPKGTVWVYTEGHSAYNPPKYR